jgi:hypothetical protein
LSRYRQHVCVAAMPMFASPGRLSLNGESPLRDFWCNQVRALRVRVRVRVRSRCLQINDDNDLWELLAEVQSKTINAKGKVCVRA